MTTTKTPPQLQNSNPVTSQSNPIFKVYELQKDDGQRKMLVFVFSENKVQYIVRGKKPIEIPFDEISHHDVVCKHFLHTSSSNF